MADARQFENIPLNRILVEEQIRKNIDIKGEAFCSFMESIRDKGVLQPVVVMKRDDRFLLISGERRFLACGQLGMETIPAVIVENLSGKEGILTIQLIENLQRENLNPIDEAGAYLSYLQNAVGEIAVEEMLNKMILFKTSPERLKPEDVPRIGTLEKISGKSSSTLMNYLSLLKLPKEIQDVVSDGRIGPTQGYLFAANVNHPELMTIFKEVLEKPVTYEALKRRFAKKEAQPQEKKYAGMKPKPFTEVYQSLRAVKTKITKGTAFKIAEIDKLMTELKTFYDRLEQLKAGGGVEKAESKPAANKLA